MDAKLYDKIKQKKMEHSDMDSLFIKEIDPSIQSILQNNHQLLMKQKLNSNIKRFR